MGEWKEITLGALVTLQRGHDLPESNRVVGNVPVLGSFGITGWHNEAKAKGIGVTVGRSGASFGIVSYSSVDYWPLNTALYVKDFHGNDPKFAYYFLKTMDFQGYNSGSAQPSLNRNHIHPIKISVPDVTEQKAIASVLSSLDDKIDLLHRQNKTLEALAETLFRQWFVEQAQEDWESGMLKQYVDIGIGRTPPRKEHQWFSVNQEDVKWISIKDLGNDGAYIFNTAEYLTRDAVRQFNVPVIPENTVVLSFKMTVGRVAITTEEMLSNEAIAHFKFEPETPFTVEYLYLYLNNFKYDSLGSTSSIVTAINSALIKNMEILIPDYLLMRKFDEAVSNLFKKIRENQVQIGSLEKLRDTLLPKLMSGEVRIDQGGR